MKFELRDRTKRFAIRIVKLIKKFPPDVAGRELGTQLIRSGTSIGANLEEADAGSSRKDFLHKTAISYKETKESRYWLEVILDAEVLSDDASIQEVKVLQAEAIELSKIFWTILNKRKE